MYENFVGTWETVRNREVSAWRGSSVFGLTFEKTTENKSKELIKKSI